MCGIAGIVDKIDKKVNYDDLRRMTDLISHRGPDGEGHYINHNVGLGHRRLAIIDLTNAGNQPMRDKDNIIVFNGEIYNYVEIRKELESKGYGFKTKTDTEVILKAYECWGKDCVKRFNGMWAFAIFDKSKDEIFISRVRFGIKPFYYAKIESRFLFGSEIKQILEFKTYRKVNRKALYDFLFLSYLHHTEDTFFDGVKSLLPGHSIIFNTKTTNYKIEKYYELQRIKINDKQKISDSVKMYKEGFYNSIKFRLRSDVKVGSCLSGGLDSSYVAMVASENYKSKEKFTAITAKSIDPSNDESGFAKKVAHYCNLNWMITEPSSDDFYGSIDKIVYSQEEPFASPSMFMQYYVMKKAKEEGCIVMLDGQGGDETLLGYERYFIAYLKSIYNPFKFVSELFKLSNNSRLSTLKLLQYYLYFGFSKIRIKRILSKSDFILEQNHKYFNKDLAKEFQKASVDIFQLQKKEICELQLPKLLKFEDRSSMAHSIEARVPFVDHKLVEMAVSLPTGHKINKGWSKYVLRKSYQRKGLEEISWRKNKFGFEAPTKKWMDNKEFFIADIKESSFLDNILKKDYSYEKLDHNTLWKLYNVAKWAQTFNVQY